VIWSWTIPEPGIIPDFGLCKPRIQLEVKRQRYSSVPGTLSTQTSDDILHDFVSVRAVIALLYAVIAQMSVVINRICVVIALTITVIITPTKVIDKIDLIAK
jgi:hypothetical protein